MKTDNIIIKDQRNYESWTEFLETFKSNEKGHQSFNPFPIKDAYHIDSEFNENGITRFQGIIKYGPVLHRLMLLATQAGIQHSVVFVKGDPIAYVVYTIWFREPLKQ